MSNKPQTSLSIQYRKCDLCQQSHRERHRHVYSKKHQQKVDFVLSKAKKKIRAARNTMDEPQVTYLKTVTSAQSTTASRNSATNQLLLCSRLGIDVPESCLIDPVSDSDKMNMLVNVWCYFCSEEVSKDLIMGEAKIEFGGFLEHLASSSHTDKRDLFWKVNKVEAHHPKYKPDSFSISSKALERFKITAEEALRKSTEDRQKTITKEAQKIHQREVYQERLTQCHREMIHSNNMDETTFPWKQASQADRGAPLLRVRTIAARGLGLTCLKLKNVDDSGNIHTGAPPPWVSRKRHKPQTTVSYMSAPADIVIGPTLGDYEKHLENVKRGKLPPNRVGAKERLTDIQGGANWLPSFGRVWSKNPRTHTRKTFMMKGKHSIPSSTITSSSGGTSHSPLRNQSWTHPSSSHEEYVQKLDHFTGKSGVSLIQASENFQSDFGSGASFQSSETSSSYINHGRGVNDEYQQKSSQSSSNLGFTKDIDNQHSPQIGYVRKAKPVANSDNLDRIQISGKLL